MANGMERRFVLKELSRYKIGTYADIVNRNALIHSKREAFIYKDERITFSQFNARVNSLIHALQSMGLKKGDGIGVLSWNCLEYTYVYGAAMKGGFIIVPFNPRLQTAEINHIINDSEVKALFVGPEMIPTVDALRSTLSHVRHFIAIEGTAPGTVPHRKLFQDFPDKEPDVPIEGDDLLIIYYTSGTTGLPRGAVYTHGRYIEAHRALAHHLGIGPSDKHVMIMPLFHIGGSSHFWAYFFAGAPNVIMPQRSYDPAATLRMIQDERATGIHIVPTHLVGMLELPGINEYDLGSLRQMVYAASPMPVELLKKGIERLGPVFAQNYGQTESGPHITFLPSESHQVLHGSPEEQRVLSSCGYPMMGVQVRVVDDNGHDVEVGVVGEIIARSKHIMAGYWRKPDLTNETLIGGWLHTGDMGYYDENGFIYIADRKKDMIISGGENIYPRDVEEVLYRHPAVYECAVIGVPDDKWVERVHAVIVLRAGHIVSTDDIVGFCKEHLARFKVPKSVEFVESLPKNPAGKILKREIRQKYWPEKKGA